MRISRFAPVLFLTAFLLLIIAIGYAAPLSWVGVKDPEKSSLKTLWDWMELLIVPAAISIGIWWLNSRDKRRQVEQARVHRETELQSILEQQRQDALQRYLSDIIALVPRFNVEAARDTSSPIAIARAKTLATLFLLDSDRKAVLIQFLYDMQLITAPDDENAYYPILDIERANLRQANLANASLWRVVLHHADLRGANLQMSILTEADLFRCNASEANFQGAELINCKMNHAKLVAARLVSTNASELKLAFADAREADFSGSLLHEADFRSARLDGAKLSGCVMQGANLSQSTLVGTDLSDADLSPRVDGKRTSLENADLRGAIIRSADLSGVDLTGARVTRAQLQAARSLEGAILPQ